MVEYLVVAAALLGAVTALLSGPATGCTTTTVLCTRIQLTADTLMGKVRDQMNPAYLGAGDTVDAFLQ